MFRSKSSFETYITYTAAVNFICILCVRVPSPALVEGENQCMRYYFKAWDNRSVTNIVLGMVSWYIAIFFEKLISKVTTANLEILYIKETIVNMSENEKMCRIQLHICWRRYLLFLLVSITLKPYKNFRQNNIINEVIRPTFHSILNAFKNNFSHVILKNILWNIICIIFWHLSCSIFNALSTRYFPLCCLHQHKKWIKHRNSARSKIPTFEFL